MRFSMDLLIPKDNYGINFFSFRVDLNIPKKFIKNQLVIFFLCFFQHFSQDSCKE
jgi:hypothetical protein